MRNSIVAVPSSIVLVAILLATLVACKPDPCEDVICAPCPSSRLVMTYQDSTGACIPGFHASARVYALSASGDTSYSYNFSDSCKAGFLVQEGLTYHVVSSNPSFMDVIEIANFGFQDPPISVTECCLCYPVEHANVVINGDTNHIEFVTGTYENMPFVRQIN